MDDPTDDAELIEMCQWLIAQGEDPNYIGKDGWTPLQSAAMGSPECVRLLLEDGANPDLQNNNGSTALHIAATVGCPVSVKLLLEHGAKTTLRDGHKHTARDIALIKGYRHIVALINSYSKDSDRNMCAHHRGPCPRCMQRLHRRRRLYNK
jgi:ankyrin repeat protein